MGFFKNLYYFDFTFCIVVAYQNWNKLLIYTEDQDKRWDVEESKHVRPFQNI